MRIALLANSSKPDAVAAGKDLLATLVPQTQAVLLTDPDPVALQGVRPDVVVVLGGDGSILRVAEAVSQLGVPVVGVNFGKLGYLAAFSLEEFRAHLDAVLEGRLAVSERLMLEGRLYPQCRQGENPPVRTATDLLAGPAGSTHRALNDVVVNAGDPFRMIELHIQIDGAETTTFRGDGVIVSTASGSTGYNLSAGGPLISPGVSAMVLTPICPHSLSFRPVVIPDSATVLIHAHRVNAGTRVSFDGQTTEPLGDDDCVVVRRAAARLKLAENPAMTHWQMLASKLQWAQSPRQ